MRRVRFRSWSSERLHFHTHQVERVHDLCAALLAADAFATQRFCSDGLAGVPGDDHPLAIEVLNGFDVFEGVHGDLRRCAERG